MKNKYLLISVLTGILIIILTINYNRIISLKIEKLNLIGESQVFLDLNSKEKMLYLSIDTLDNKLTHNIIVKECKKEPLIFPNLLFSGFLNDTMLLNFEEKTIYTYNLNNGNSVIIDTLYFDINNFSFETIKVTDYETLNGFYYLKNTEICFYCITNKKISRIFSLKDIPSAYLQIRSFDVYNNKLLICTEKAVVDDQRIFDYYLVDLDNKNVNLLYNSKETKNLTYKPLVRFINDNEFITNFYYNKSKSVIQKFNIPNKKISNEYRLREGVYVINICVSHSIYLSLFDDAIRNAKNNKDLAIAFFSGVNTYKIKNASLTPR